MASSQQAVETAKQLVQRVCRAFYESKQCIVIDQLIRKEAMRDDELAGRVGLKAPDLAKIAQKLIEDKIVSQVRRQETKEGALKAIQRAYYYMDYSYAVDVVKWRMYQIHKQIRGKDGNLLDQQGYVCPRCKKAYSTLDTGMLSFTVEGFICEVCGANLIDNENEEEVRNSKDRMQRLVEQTKVISDLLKKMEDLTLPRFDVHQWLDLNGPAASSAVVEGGDTTNAAGTVRIELAGEDDEAKMKAKREADAAEKRAQNQLPSWIAQSTVSGEATARQLELQALEDAANADSKADIKPSLLSDDLADTGTAQDDIDSYYAQLEAEGDDAPLTSFLDSSPKASVEPTLVPLPVSRNDSPAFSGVGTPGGDGAGSEADFAEIANAVQKGFEGMANGAAGGGSGKRSRDETDSGWEEGMSEEITAVGKKARVGSVGLDDGGGGDEFDDDEDEFEEVEGDGDPNPLIKVGDKEVPFLEVTDDQTAEMTPEEYTVYWEVFQRLG